MDEIYLFLTIVLAGLAGLLCIVSCASWYRLKSLKLGLISIAFLLFCSKAVLLILTIIVQDVYAILLDVCILVVLYFSVAKK